MLLPHHILLSLAATFPSIALAALYPTYPTADTPLEAGQDTILKWKNDKNQPAIWDLGRLRIDLFVGDDDHHVTTLAKNINPEDRAALVRIEPWVGADADDYYIRFTPPEPQEPIYTSRFAVRGLTGSSENHEKYDNTNDDRQPNEAQASNDQGSEDGNDGEEGSAADGSQEGNDGDNNDDPVDGSSVDAHGVDGVGPTTAIPLLSVSGTTTFTLTGSLSGSTQASSSTSTSTTSAARFVPISPTTPVSNPSTSQSGDSLVNNANSASSRFKRSRENSFGFSGIGLVYLTWPLVMGAVMAF